MTRDPHRRNFNIYVTKCSEMKSERTKNKKNSVSSSSFHLQLTLVILRPIFVKTLTSWYMVHCFNLTHMNGNFSATYGVPLSLLKLAMNTH